MYLITSSSRPSIGYFMPNSLVCRLEASATHNVISEIVIVVHRDLAIIMISRSGGEFPSELHACWVRVL